MHPDDDRSTDPRNGIEAGFRAIVATLRRSDPRFARRCSSPRPGWPSAAGLAVAAGVVVTLLLGVLPLAMGLHVGTPALLALGASFTLAMPVTAPLAVFALLSHHRPLWV